MRAMAELDDLLEHLERFRAVTLQALDMATDDDLGWRPGPEHYTLGQQFLHIGQSEDFQIQAHLNGDWDYERCRFPARELKVDELQELLRETRDRTMAALIFAAALEKGARPEVEIREKMGGF